MRAWMRNNPETANIYVYTSVSCRNFIKVRWQEFGKMASSRLLLSVKKSRIYS